MERKWAIGILFLLLVFPVHAQEIQPITELDSNQLTDSNQAVINPVIQEVQTQINDLHRELELLKSNQLPSDRISDAIILVEQQFAQEKEGFDESNPFPFSGTQQRIAEVFHLLDLAVSANDEIIALEKRIDKIKDEIDEQPILELLKKAKTEMQNERFENVEPITSQGYEKITELQSFQTQTQARADAARANIVGFIDNYKTEIGLLLFIGIILFFLLRNRLRLWWIQNQIKSLELEKQTLRDEIRNAQEEFFKFKRMNERLYHVREEVFSEMLREVTRKIAVLMEEEKRMRIFKLEDLWKKKPSQQK